MKASDLKGRAVVTLADAAKIGQVDDVLFDAAFRQVLGFRVKQGTFSRSEAVTRANVSAVGADALTVPPPRRSTPKTASPTSPARRRPARRTAPRWSRKAAPCSARSRSWNWTTRPGLS